MLQILQALLCAPFVVDFCVGGIREIFMPMIDIDGVPIEDMATPGRLGSVS